MAAAKHRRAVSWSCVECRVGVTIVTAEKKYTHSPLGGLLRSIFSMFSTACATFHRPSKMQVSLYP